MTAYRINYYLYRSNPIIMREMKIPGEYTGKDFIAALCLGMGIPESEGEIWNEEETLIPEKCTLSEIFGTGMEFHQSMGHVTIYQDKKTKDIISLTFLFEVLEELKEQPAAPEILWEIGSDLPQKVFQMSQINEILENLNQEESYTLAGVGTFYKAQVQYQPRKTRNQLYSRFAPELASNLKMELGVPLSVVLENKSVQELSELCEIHNTYPYNKRKAEYISVLCKKLENTDMGRVLDEMDILEYLEFRKLITTGKTPCRNNEGLEEMFPVLNFYGLITIAKKNGPLLSMDLLQHYEEWVEEKGEKEFRTEKRIAFVMKGCAFYYGIFSKEHCWKVLETLYPGETEREIFDKFWKEPFRGTHMKGIFRFPYEAEKEPFAYDEKMFDKEELPLYYRALSEDTSERYIPGREEFEDACLKGVALPFEIWRALWDIFGYGYYGKKEEYFQNTIRYLRKGNSAAEVSVKLVESFGHFWRPKEELIERLEKQMNLFAEEVPCILYYGYSLAQAKRKGIHSDVKNNVERMEEEKRKEEAERKRLLVERKEKAAAARKAAKTKATRTARSTGKRGTTR